jgi:AcrR family transcriptional regulator
MKKIAVKHTKAGRTRAAILEAAQALFAEIGYERTTIRGVAGRASADPALVIRYFGSKDGLFAQATSFDLKLPDLSGAPRGKIGHILIVHFLELWEGALSNGSLPILLRAAASNEGAAERIRQIFAGQVIPALRQAAVSPDAEKRAGLISSHLLGLALSRYILKLPVAVSLTKEEIIQSVGPALQRYLTGQL